jgi:hypothetical protein
MITAECGRSGSSAVPRADLFDAPRGDLNGSELGARAKESKDSSRRGLAGSRFCAYGALLLPGTGLAPPIPVLGSRGIADIDVEALRELGY